MTQPDRPDGYDQQISNRVGELLDVIAATDIRRLTAEQRPEIICNCTKCIVARVQQEIRDKKPARAPEQMTPDEIEEERYWDAKISGAKEGDNDAR